MDHTLLSMETWEETLKFLDRAATQYDKQARKKELLDDKLKYYRKAKDIKKARSVLLSLQFQMEDYVNMGKFEPSRIISPSKDTNGI